ncbi:MAG: peptidylprolyl isomerase [Candidatus Zixiibacteriota bacterium]|nr:MAG: peptidylprolyl isomerase [candidate division Zixibacteria bacterium]
MQPKRNAPVVLVSPDGMKAHPARPMTGAGGLVVLLIGLLLLFCSLSAAQQVLDRIVAVVGDEIISDSELELQLTLYVNQMGIELKSEEQKSELKAEMLEQMVNDRLLLLAAQKDTTIEVTSREVEEAVKEQLDRVKSEFTEEEFKAQLKAEGLTEGELKKRYREQTKEKMMTDRLIGSKLSRVSVSTREVKDFYEAYKDSIPDQPEAVKLSHILLEVGPSSETLDSLRSEAERVRDLAERGEDFARLASTYSDDPSGDRGGDLGFFQRGDMIPKFEEVAFALEPGEISDVVETQFGYHIIRVEEKKDDQVHARHILLLVSSSKTDTTRVQQLADSLYQLLIDGADFAELAKEFSSDEESKKMGGELGWYPVEQMTPEIKEGVKDLEIDQVSLPVRSQFGIHILKALDRREGRKLNLEDDWDVLKDMVRRKKTNDVVTEWVEKLRQEIYVEIRL